MQDKSSKTLTKVADKTKDIERQTRKANNMVKKFGKDTAAAMGGMIKNATKLAAAGAAATMVFAKKSVDAAQVQLGNELKLKTVLKQRTNATKEQIDSIMKLTAAQQANGVVGDEVQLAGAQQIATFVSNTKSVNELIPAMNNLLVQRKGLNGTTEDAVNIGNMMGKVLMGQTGALKKVGITFSTAEEKVLKYGTEEEKAAMLAKVITNNVGDMNKEMANTDQGAIQQAKNLFGDMQEQVGMRLLPYLGRFSKWFSKNLPTIQAKVLAATDAIISGTKKVYKFIQKVYMFFMKYRTVITLIGIFVVTLATVISVVTTVAGVVTALTAATTALNITLGLCPIVWIIAIIALVIAAVIAMIIYWDKIKEVAAKVWASVKESFGNMKQSVIDAFNSMVEKVKKLWADLKEFLKHPIKGTVKLFKKSNEDNEQEQTGTINKNALGTSYWKGGMTSINERGGEIIDLPNGSRVIPADKSKKITNSKNVTIGNINITAKGVTSQEVLNEVVPVLKLAIANM